jgi:hypothetical protein
MFRTMVRDTAYVSLLWSEEDFWKSDFHKHYVPTGRGKFSSSDTTQKHALKLPDRHRTA